MAVIYIWPAALPPKRILQSYITSFNRLSFSFGFWEAGLVCEGRFASLQVHDESHWAKILPRLFTWNLDLPDSTPESCARPQSSFEAVARGFA